MAVVLLLGFLLSFAVSPARPQAADSGYRATADGTLVGPDGRPFFLLGANYEGPNDRAWQMWADDKWDAGRVEADLSRAAKYGINSLRIFVQRPLADDVNAGRFGKIDAFLDLAAKYKLAIVLTLADYGEDDLVKIAATARRIAEHLRERPIVLAYDLKNEPKYATLVLAKYPAGVVPPLLADGLVARYGERLPMSEVESWRAGDGKALSPARFSAADVYRTANHYKLYREFLSDSATWVAGRDGVSTMDYLDSPDSAKWRPFVDALSGTLAAWLAPQVEAVRAADPARLVTVGYNDPILAKLSANAALSFMSLHRYPGTSVKSLKANLGTLDNLRRSFPGRPVALTEFGWSNAGLDADSTAVLEAATWLYLWTSGSAGALKWMLDDLPPVGDPKEDNLGVFRLDGTPKPIALAIQALAIHLGRASKPGQLQLDGEGDLLRYLYSADDAVFLGGKEIGEKRIAFRPSNIGQLFVQWSDGLRIQTTTKADLDLNVGALLGRPLDQGAVLQRSGAPVSSKRDGDRLLFSVDPGLEYRLKIPVNVLEPRIQIVWPQGNAPVTQAVKANIGVYLFERGGKRIACPDGQMPPVRLWRSVNNGIEEPVAVGERRTERAGTLAFPSFAFNDVDVSAAKDPANKVFFRVAVDGIPSYGSVWSHGADARTIFPQVDVPSGAEGAPAAVDAKIEIVWPLADKPVAQADKANVGVYLFNRGSLRSVGIDWNPTVRLWRSVNNGPMEVVATGVKSPKRSGDLSFPVWTFNDTDVSPAKDPENKVFFRVSVDGVDSRSNVWSHAADARTNFPQRETPQGVVNCQ